MARMDTFKGFEFFPPPPIPSVPTIALPNPHNRQPSLNKNIAVAAEQPLRADSGISMNTKREHDSGTSSRNDSFGSNTSQDTAKLAVASSPIDGHSRTTTPQPPPPALASYTSTSRTYVPADAYSQASAATALSGAATLVHHSNSVSKGVSSPIPLRSMFPVYNPAVPLNQQSYYPQRQTSLQARMPSRGEYPSRVGTPSQTDLVTGGLRTAPASIYNSPMDTSSLPDTTFSSPRELEKLWQASHGMEANSEIGSFNLEMARLVCFLTFDEIANTHSDYKRLCSHSATIL